MQLSRRVMGLRPSATLAIDSQAKALKAQGYQVINFGVGEPDLPTPAFIAAAGVRAIEEGFTKYTAGAGLQPLRAAIGAKLGYSADEVIVSAGAKQAIYNAVLALVDPGDEVIVPAPYWVSYPEMVKLAGGVPVTVDTSGSAFKLTPDQLRGALSAKTRLVILNSPNNPTGVVYTQAELAALAEVAQAADVWLLSDEIYGELDYSGQFCSLATLGEAVRSRTLVIGGVSKAYAMTGWRLGWALGPQPVIAAMARLQGHSTSAPSSISQRAALEALTAPEAASAVAALRQTFEQRRQRMLEGLAAWPGCEVGVEPAGAFYVFVSVARVLGRSWRGQTIADAEGLATLLLNEVQVATVPGAGFGAPEFLRLSYATSEEEIVEGCRRVAALLSEVI